MNILARYVVLSGILFSTVAISGCNIDLVDAPPPPVTVVHTYPVVVPDHYGPPAAVRVDHYGPPAPVVSVDHYGPPARSSGHYGAARPRLPNVTVTPNG